MLPPVWLFLPVFIDVGDVKRSDMSVAFFKGRQGARCCWRGMAPHLYNARENLGLSMTSDSDPWLLIRSRSFNNTSNTLHHYWIPVSPTLVITPALRSRSQVKVKHYTRSLLVRASAMDYCLMVCRWLYNVHSLPLINNFDILHLGKSYLPVVLFKQELYLLCVYTNALHALHWCFISSRPRCAPPHPPPVTVGLKLQCQS